MRRYFICLIFFLGLTSLFCHDVAMAADGVQGIVLPEDPTKAYITLGILAIAAVLFFTEAIPLPITAMLVPIALSLTHVLSAKVAFSYFGNPTVVLFMAMFIVGEATFITGFADKIGALAVRFSKGNPLKLMLYAMIAIGMLSTVLSDTGTTAVAVPMILGMCATAKLSPSKVLMPVAFASLLGGTVTLVGTPPNGIVNSILQEGGVRTFGFFEYAWIGIPLLISGLLYFALIGHRLLPQGREDVSGSDEATETVRERRENKFWHATAIFVFVVIMMATELMPLTVAAMLGACLVVITGCMTMREAFRSVDWSTIFLFAGMLSMSGAMDKSGAAAIVAHTVVNMVHEPSMIMLACCALTAVATNFMSNTATAALMAPLVMPIAVATGISPLPLLMGVAASASCGFLTPIATPSNTIVFGPGKYRFLDFVKVGWPLQLITLVITWLLVPVIWPFYP